jgi:SAM-dependent methyltransferase
MDVGREGRSDTPSTSNVEGAAERWSEGLDEETEYWFRWLRDREPWPEQFAFRTDPESELQHHIRRYVASPPGARVRILDVGSGPLTVLGKRWEDRTLEITAVDPLAERYAKLFDRVGLEPLVRPVLGEAERLTELFPPDSFELVYAQNCVDHGYDPLRSIQQMLSVVKPGHFVLLEHAIDEGEHMQYAGPHQWNFREHRGRFVIWRPGLWLDAHERLEEQADIEIESRPEERWIRVGLRKHEPASHSTSEVEGAVERWREGLEEEGEFWFRWLRDREPWPEQFPLRTDPDAELQSWIRRYLDSPPDAHLRILDVGAGPMTVLGKRWGARRLDFTAVDPLAEKYAQLLEQNGITPLVRTSFGEAEHVADIFPPASF